MRRVLDIGAADKSGATDQIDIAPFNEKTVVCDVAVEPLPYSDQTFDEVRLEGTFEHIEACIHWKEDGKWHRRFPRIELMKEIYRVLKPGGIAHISVPNLETHAWAHDPTHVDVPIVAETFGYFKGGYDWDNDMSTFLRTSYGIDFKFEHVEDFQTGSLYTIRLRKP